MWHAAVLLALCVATNWVHLRRMDWPAMRTVWPYLLLWGGGLAVWGPTFWALRRRQGPVTAVERQIAQQLGPEKILFGTDMPALDPWVQRAKVEGAEISDDAKRLIMGGNIQRILGL